MKTKIYLFILMLALGSSVSAATFNEVLEHDLRVLDRFSAVAGSKVLTPAVKVSRLGSLVKWAKAESANQLGSFNPLHLAIEWRLKRIQDLVEAGKFSEADQIVRSEFARVLEAL